MLQRLDALLELAGLLEELRQLLQQHAHALPRPVRDGRVARNDLLRLHVPAHAALRRHDRALLEPQVSGDPRLPAQRDVVLELGAARDADLRDDDAVAADAHVVADLHQVVDLGAVPDPGAVGGRAVHATVGADLDVVADHHVADLRDLVVAAGVEGEAEAVGPDHHPGVQDAPRADDALLADHDPGIEEARLAHLGPRADVATRHHDRTGAEPGARLDHAMRTDRDVLAERGVRRDHRARVHPRGGPVEVGAEDAHRLLEGQVRVVHLEQRDGALAGLPVADHRGGPGLARGATRSARSPGRSRPRAGPPGSPPRRGSRRRRLPPRRRPARRPAPPAS